MDEPSNGELAWRLENIQRTLTDLVGRPEYAARQEAQERRFQDLTADLATIGERLDRHERDHRETHHNWRALLFTGVLPAVVAAIAIIVQILASGGK